MIDLNMKALDLCKIILKTSYLGKSGHIASALSVLDIITALYFGGILNYDPQYPDFPMRDRFILSKGHASLALYAVLCEAGFFKREELNTYCKPGTIFGDHPTQKIPGIEAATGSLGHGLSFGAGLALSAKLKHEKHLTYVVTGDGECQEGSIWEAAMSIAKFNLTNLIWIIDHNKLQADGEVNHVMPLNPLDKKLRAFGFFVESIDGHDYNMLSETLKIDRNKLPQKPLAVIANTIKGKRIALLENKQEWHSKRPTDEEWGIIISQIKMTKEAFEQL